MRFKSKKIENFRHPRENGENNSNRFGSKIVQIGAEAKPLFKLCREGKVKELKGLINFLEKRGSLLTIINQPDSSDEDNNTLLHLSVKAESLEIVDLLMTLGANPSIKNARSETPAHVAARAGNLEILKFLVENGGLHGILDDLIIRSRYNVKYLNTRISKFLFHSKTLKMYQQFYFYNF